VSFVKCPHMSVRMGRRQRVLLVEWKMLCHGNKELKASGEEISQ